MKNSTPNSVKSYSVSSVAFAVPWCCVLPAVLAVFGLAGTAAMRLTLMQYTPFLLIFSALFLGRANYLTHIKKQGNGVSRLIVGFSTLFAFGLWFLWFSMI